MTALVYTCTDVNEARPKMFHNERTPDVIPPSHAALEQNIKHAAYQGGHIWGQTYIASP